MMVEIKNKIYAALDSSEVEKNIIIHVNEHIEHLDLIGKQIGTLINLNKAKDKEIKKLQKDVNMLMMNHRGS